MNSYKTFFRDKRVTVLGLGLLGKRLLGIQFLSKYGAKLIVTDLKTRKELLPSIKKLEKYKGIIYRLGKHILSDFENRDFILKGQGTPLNSPYIAHAKKKGISVEMDESLFLKLAPKNIKVIGVTGTRGKTTTTMLIYHTLKKAGVRAHLGGNIRNTSLLTLLPKVKLGDTVVLELSSWQLQCFEDMKYSPKFAVFTNFSKDHLNYYGSMKKYFFDKSLIYKYQKKSDHLVIGDSIASLIKKSQPKAKVHIVKKTPLLDSWNIKIPGEHNKENIACAIELLKAYGLSMTEIKKGVETFDGVPGRLEYRGTRQGVKIYNDTTATTPEALSKALTSFSGKDIILLAGGTTKELPLGLLPSYIKKLTKEVVLLPGTGTNELLSKLKDKKVYRVKTLKEGVKKALSLSKKGDIFLFSPGFSSFGLFKNEYDRGDQFNIIIKSIKES